MTGSEPARLQGGVIAAGHGMRLRADGYRVSKAMIPVGGRPLINHALDRLRAVGVRRVSIIINEESDDCRHWLDRNARDLDLDLVVRTTPSSYESFKIVAERLAPAPAVMTTIDAIMPVDDFRRFVRSAAGFAEDATVLGLTAHIDDADPLWATLDLPSGRVRRLGDPVGSHVTAGVYWLPARRIAEPKIGFARLRDYLKWLVRERRQVYGVVLPLVFDVDRARDVRAAELAELFREREKAGNDDGQCLLGHLP
ncbi:MAG: NDP-sugar synthase [Hyphomicrobiales bacterium]|nr:NDP-sugar synthase [Hyphomicrobiales bacterium]